MFSGIIQAQGNIKNIKKTSGGALFCFIVANNFLATTKIGDSISSNGVCLTVTQISDNSFYADLSKETLKLTNFAFAKIDDEINFEKSLTLKQGIDGHLVSGHIDGTAKVVDKNFSGDNIIYTIQTSDNLSKYIVKKGSITLNGISLTINEIVNNVFKVNIVPHTLKSTNLANIQVDGYLNIEVDMIARYLEKLIK